MPEYKIACLVCLAVGLIAGFLICSGLYLRRNVGTLRIDRSDPDEPPYFFLEVTNIKRITDGKTVCMRVKEENYISQETHLL